jgi:hypothetical protein
MAQFKSKFHNTESVAFAMMKKGTLNYRKFSDFIIIKNESVIVDLENLMKGIGGDVVSVHTAVKRFLENA